MRDALGISGALGMLSRHHAIRNLQADTMKIVSTKLTGDLSLVDHGWNDAMETAARPGSCSRCNRRSARSSLPSPRVDRRHTVLGAGEVQPARSLAT